MVWEMNVTDGAKTVATAFVEARRLKRGLAAYPGTPPSDMTGAYRIQDLAIALDARAVAGWKVGKIGPADTDILGTDRLAGPIFAGTVLDIGEGTATPPDMPVFADGFAAVEAEFLLHLAPGWNGQIPADDAEVRALLDGVHIGIEIASSPYAGINADGPLVTASDFGNNYGLIVGPALEDWQNIDFNSICVAVAIDGEVVGKATTATMLDGPLGAARFLLGNLVQRKIACDAGFWISSGAVTGVHQVLPGAQVTATFAPGGTVRCGIVAASRD